MSGLLGLGGRRLWLAYQTHLSLSEALQALKWKIQAEFKMKAP